MFCILKYVWKLKMIKVLREKIIILMWVMLWWMENECVMVLMKLSNCWKFCLFLIVEDLLIKNVKFNMIIENDKREELISYLWFLCLDIKIRIMKLNI